MSDFKFVFQMLKHLKGNQCFSPVNISHALGMVMLGTEAETREEIASVLGRGDHTQTHTVLQKALDSMKSKEIANIAAKLFIQRGFEVKSPFQDACQAKYGAATEKVDFADAASSVETINKWVAGETKEMIKDLLSASDVDANTMIALCSALHFKGSWENPFDAPFEDDFHLSESSSVKTQMMQKKFRFAFNYSGELEAQVVELPYSNGASMLLVVPQYIGGLNGIEDKITPDVIDDLVKNLDRSGGDEVLVKMPKFELEVGMDLKDTLEKCGLTRIFNPEVNPLSEMTHAGLHIGAAVHKVKIIVDDKGTEAAAATGMIGMMRMMPMMPIMIEANKPFLFFIRYEGETVFAGRFASPN